MWRVLVFFLAFLPVWFSSGCSGSSGGGPPSFSYPIPTDLTIIGSIDLSNVAIHSTLGGITPSLLNHSGFKITVQDDPTPSAVVSQTGSFTLAGLSIRDQIVLRAEDQNHPGFALEWMAVDAVGLFGIRSARIGVPSTARSLITRAMRDRYGRRLNPDLLTDAQIASTAKAIYQVLERNPELLSATGGLETAPAVRKAVDEMAAGLDRGNAGDFPRDWTILVYQAGDNQLAAEFRKDLEDMQKIVLPSRIALLIQSDLPFDGIRRFWINQGKSIELGKVGIANSADPLKVADFLAWAHRAFPARRFALFLSSHGTGWRGEEAGRGILSDTPTGATVDFVSLKQALLLAETHQYSFQRPLDLLGFDASLMASLEVAWQIGQTTRYGVFSQANEPASGWDYRPILAALASSPAIIDGEALGKLICNSYFTTYTTPPLAGRYSGTMSLITTANLPTLQSTFSAWAGYLADHASTLAWPLSGLRDSLRTEVATLTGTERYRVQAFELPDYRDLIDLVEASTAFDEGTRLTAEPFLKAFSSTVIHTVRFGPRYTRAHGLSIALPSAADAADYGAGLLPGRRYADLDLAIQSRWDDVLLAINPSPLGRVDGRGLKVELSWSSDADFDLYIGTPDPTAATDPSRLLWQSSVAGSASPDGSFHPDSLQSKLREETWTGAPMVSPGRYWVIAVHASSSPDPRGVSPRVKITSLSSSQSFVGPEVVAGRWFEAAIIDVSTTAVQVRSVPVPEIPEAAMKSLEQAIIAAGFQKNR